MSSDRLRVAIIGWGAIAQTAVGLIEDRPIDVVAIAVKDPSRPRSNLPADAVLVSSPEELADLGPDVVAEAAGRETVAPWGHAAFRCGADFVVSSVSALADPALLDALRSSAAEHGARLHIQTGALGGIDALAGARLMGIDTVQHRIVKPPDAWRGTPAESLCDLQNLTESTIFYNGTASETASAFPKNANVAMTTALAGIGPELTEIVLVADPTANMNRHEISATGAFGTLEVAIANNPLPDNPKSSAMAALNLARALQGRVDAVLI